jgi:hypothetical protein
MKAFLYSRQLKWRGGPVIFLPFAGQSIVIPLSLQFLFLAKAAERSNWWENSPLK